MTHHRRKRGALEPGDALPEAKKSKPQIKDLDGEVAPRFIPAPDDDVRNTSTPIELSDEGRVLREDESGYPGRSEGSKIQTFKVAKGSALGNGEKRKTARREDRKRSRLKHNQSSSVADTGAADQYDEEYTTVEGVKAAGKTQRKDKRTHPDVKGNPKPQNEPVNPNRVAVNAKHWIAGEVHGKDLGSETTSGDAKKDKPQRFIAFIGNLPYSANVDSITKHFSAIAPFSVRAPTNPSTGKSKGYAFLEFEGYDKMKSCLKLYHHSNFGEGKSARKINVELTAGGGGKGENRKAKIKEKNDRLKEERKKAHEDEAKARKEGKRSGVSPADGGDEEMDENADVHPSRRKRMGL